MDIIKIILVSFIGLFSVVILKNVKNELAVYAGITTGVVVLFMIFSTFTDVLDAFKTSIDVVDSSINSGSSTSIIQSSIVKALIKIVGIGYLTEYSSSVCDDYGSTSIGKKIQLGGKVCIFSLSLPIIINVINTITSLF